MLLEREVAVMRQLKHPNVVSIVCDCPALPCPMCNGPIPCPLFPQIRYLGSQSERDGPCPVVHVFMEYAQGGSLSDVLRRYGALAERVVAVYTKQILRGLRYLHEHGMAHRDIKGASH